MKEAQAQLENIEEEFRAYRQQTEEYEKCLEQELQEKEQMLSELVIENEKSMESVISIREKYSKNESELASLQQTKENLLSQLSAFRSQKRELESLNDQWEQSTRALEYYKQDLEDKLYQIEEEAVICKEEIDFLTVSKDIELQRLHEKRQELEQEILSINDKELHTKEFEKKFATLSPNSIRDQYTAATTPMLQDSNTIKVFAKPRISQPQDLAKVKGNTIMVKGNKSFQFEKVIVNDNILEEVAEGIDNLLKGGKVCIITFGQSGTGKTHTMDKLISQFLNQFEDNGLEAKLSCVEVYNEMCRNLLSKDILKRNWREVTVSSEVSLSSNWKIEVQELIKKAKENKSIKHHFRSTETYVRSHAIYTLRFKFGLIQFVDLAGSEKLTSVLNKRDVLKETLLLNKSLSALQDVIAAMENKQKFIPFRNSVLTQVLQSTLGSNDSYLALILTCSLSDKHAQETSYTLSLGTRLKTIGLTLNLKSSLKNQEVERTLVLLEKERIEKGSLQRKLDKLERDLETYCVVLKEKDLRTNKLTEKVSKQEKRYRDEVENLRKVLKNVKNKGSEAEKKLKVLKVQAGNESRTRSSARRSSNKRNISFSPHHLQNHRQKPTSYQVRGIMLTPSRIPQPKISWFH